VCSTGTTAQPYLQYKGRGTPRPHCCHCCHLVRLEHILKLSIQAAILPTEQHTHQGESLTTDSEHWLIKTQRNTL
jgi:hypothetical protein